MGFVPAWFARRKPAKRCEGGSALESARGIIGAGCNQEGMSTMATTHYTAKVKDERLLELPEAARALRLQIGEEVFITLDRDSQKEARESPQGMLAALRLIAERQNDRRYTDGTETDRLLREGRAGAMWDHEPVE